MNALLRIIAAASALIASPLGAAEFTIPTNYPAEYRQLIDESHSQPEVLIYSNISTTNWEPFLAFAKEKFPWIRVTATDENTQFEKYYAESGSNVRTADLIITFAPEQWYNFLERGQVTPYKSPEAANLPEWSLKGGEGIYAASFDPFIFSYNRRAFANMTPPLSVAEVASGLANNPDIKNRIGSYTPEVSLGLTIWQAWTSAKGEEGWKLIEAIGSSMRPEQSAGTLREKVSTGEYAVAMFTSGAGIRQYETPAIKALAGWGYPSDGTPLMQRSVAITKAAASPTSAKLILDLLLSRDGQIAFAKGGQSPYRLDIKPADVPFPSYNAIAAAVGEENIILITPKKFLIDEQKEFMKRWNSAIGR
ncbi:iron(III) transport system substrate-binding protein [Xaviernesmea oryzae]|uniref:Iron(III) transport system substrate-binding protein n=1 Tax=Xaviernesmea oryzae TaxID=464029 RepID=A0A1X7FRP5_9HYPH|nr:ABC transporter substrate-binding protein [Xaviernesmea oryzae]SMF56695.1 iron(III) transport system substrate-binding protein [Xaviernesmea oryzae]